MGSEAIILGNAENVSVAFNILEKLSRKMMHALCFRVILLIHLIHLTFVFPIFDSVFIIFI